MPTVDKSILENVDQLNRFAARYGAAVIAFPAEDWPEAFCDFYEIKNRNLKPVPSPDGFCGTLREVCGYDVWQPIAGRTESLFGLPRRVAVFEDAAALKDEMEGPDGLGPFFFIFDMMFCEYDTFTLCFISGSDD